MASPLLLHVVMRSMRGLWLASMVALGSACAEGGDALHDDPNAFDDWGGVTGTSMQRPESGDFGIGDEPGDPSERDPGEESVPEESESPADEDPSVEPVGDDGTSTDPREEGSEPAGEGDRASADEVDSDPGAEPTDEMPTDEDLLGGDAEYLTAAPSVRRSWFFTPRGTPIFLNGVNTVYATSHQSRIGRYLATHGAAAEWARISSRSGFGLNWIGSWVAADNPVIAADGSRAPYGAVLSLSPSATLHRHGDPAAQVVLRTDGQPMSSRGHWLQDPHQTDGHTVLCAGISRRVYGDPFNPDYQLEAEAEIERQVAPHRHRANLVMYYMGNEQGIGDFTREHRGSNPDAAYCAHGTGIADLRRFLWTECPQGSSIDAPMCAPHAFGFFLRDRYGSIDALNRAWGARYATFDALLADRPQPDAATRGDDLADFALILVRQWVRVTTEAIRRSDTTEGGALIRRRARPIGSPRLALANDRAFRFYSLGARADRWTTGGAVPDPHARRAGVRVNTTAYPELDATRVRFDPYRAFGRFASQPEAGFDVIAVNVYTGAARFSERWLHAGFQRLRALSDRALMVSEFGLRLRDSCWTNAGGAASYVGSSAPYRTHDPRDIERGRRYVSQVRQLVREGAVAVSWHRWADDEQSPAAGAPRVARCGNLPLRNGQRKGLLRGNGARYEGLFHAIHALNQGLYGQLRAARTWWQ